MRKSFLSVNRPFVTLDRPKLSFRIQRNQRVTPFPFLILKRLLLESDAGARVRSAGAGDGFHITLQDRRTASRKNKMKCITHASR